MFIIIWKISFAVLVKFANELYGFIICYVWRSQVNRLPPLSPPPHHIILRIKHVGEIVKVAGRFLVKTKNNNHNYNVTPSTDDKPNQIVPLHLIVARKPKIAVFILQIYEKRFRSRALQLYSWCIGRSLTRPECYLNMLLCIPVAHDPPTTTFAHFTIKMSASYFLSSYRPKTFFVKSFQTIPNFLIICFNFYTQ